MVQFLPLLTSLGNGELMQTLTCCAASSQVEKDTLLYFSTVQGCSLTRAVIFLCGFQVTLNLALYALQTGCTSQRCALPNIWTI